MFEMHRESMHSIRQGIERVRDGGFCPVWMQDTGNTRNSRCG